MSRLFLSHSSLNNAEAIAINDWLAENGWDDVFLDLDPERGITAGERWERALSEAANRCEAVVFLVSRAWLASTWCPREFHLARRLNKRMFGVLIEDIPLADLPRELPENWQIVNLASGADHEMRRATLPDGSEAHVTFSASGLKRLRAGLAKAGLDPRFFAWPPENEPERAPYRGLKALEAEDAGIFFGREAQVIEGLDALRGLSDSPPPRLTIILGASGAGKSSFLRAGLWPRLKRDDRHFLPLPVIRPERGVITGDTGLIRSLEAALKAAGLARTRADVKAVVEAGPEALKALLAELAEKATPPALDEETVATPPAIVIPIDQGEELFLGEGAAEGAAFLNLIAALLKDDAPRILALVTIRSDRYEPLQTAPALEGIRQHTMSLAPLVRGAYSEVIEGPARRLAGTRRELTIEPALTAALLADIEEGGAKDALPLLAFTLERLYLEHGGDSKLSVADYEALGRVKGSIEAAVERALKAADADPGVPKDREARLKLLRRGLVPWLAGIDPDTGSPRRRVARLSEIPEEARPLIQHLVEARLLATDRKVERDEATGAETVTLTIEPAHEALLRQWGLLEGWLAEDFGALTALEGVKRAASEWAANGKRAAWLAHRGGRLEEAERQAAREAFAGYLDAEERAYLAACRAAEIADLCRERFINRVARVAAVLATIASVIAIAFYIQATQERDQAAQQRNEAQLRESELLAGLADQELARGNPVEATLIALEGLPDATSNEEARRTRPFMWKADRSLAHALSAAKERRVFAGHDRSVYSVAFAPDGCTALSGSADRTLKLWDVATSLEIRTFTGHTNLVTSVAFAPDGRTALSGSSDRTLKLWDVATGREIRSFTGHESGVWSVAFAPDGRTALSGSADNTLKLWDVATGREIRSFTGHTNWVSSVAFAPDGRTVLSGSADNTLKLWDVATGRELRSFTGHTNWVYSVAFAPDGRTALSGSADNTIKLWDVATGRELRSFTGHADLVLSVAFAPDGRTALSGSVDNTIRLWDVATSLEIRTFTGHTNLVTSVAFAPDGRTALSGSSDRTLRLWDVATGRELRSFPSFTGQTKWVYSVAFAPDGRTALSGSVDNTIRLWDVATSLEIRTFTGHTNLVTSVAFAPDGRTALSGSSDRTLRLWDVATGREIRSFTGHTGWVYSVAFAPDGRTALSGSADNTLKLWDVATGRELRSFTGHARPLRSVAFAPDGRTALSGSWDNTLKLWDVASGRELRSFTGHTGDVEAVAFAPDGRTALSGGDKTPNLWEVASGRKLRSFTGHTLSVYSVALAPDGRTALSGSRDGTLKLWDVATGRELRSFTEHTHWVYSVAFAPDGRTALSGSRDGTLKLWDLTVGQALVDKAKARLPRCLSYTQRAQYSMPPAPPRWCITGAGLEAETDPDKWQPKFPYQTPEWRDWLIASDRGEDLPLPADNR